MSKIKRQTRIRRKIQKVADRPRLTVFRSNQYCYAQIIDQKGDTVLGLSEKKLTNPASRMENAKALGVEIAKKAIEKNIKAVVFDKGSFAYHGKIKAIAEGAREGGLQF